MARNVIFDLPNTTVPAGILKMQVTADLTGFTNVTGIISVDTGVLSGFGGAAFLTEMIAGGKVNILIGATQTEATVLTVTGNGAATIDDVVVFGDIDSMKFIKTPSTNFLIVMDEQVEKVDVKMGVYEYDEFTLGFAEDYSWYVAGFWYNLFRLTAGSAMTFFVRMEESGTDSFVTYGDVHLTNVGFNELALNEPNITNANSKIRIMRASVLNGLDIYKNVTTTQLLAEVVSHVVALNAWGNPLNCFRLIDVINSATSLAFGQTFDNANTQIRNGNEITFKRNAAGYDPDTVYTFDYLWVMDSETSAGTHYGFPDSLSTVAWVNAFPTAFELIKMICFSFGFIPRHYFGQSDGTYVGDGSDKHRIELLTRGNSGSVITMEGSIIESDNTPYSPLVINNILASRRDDASDCDYFFNSSLNPLTTEIAEVQGSTPPNFVNFDMSIVTDFAARYTYTPSFAIFQNLLGIPTTLTYPTVGAVIESPSTVRYYDYQVSDFVEIGESGITNWLPIALARYYYYKFKGQATYNRTYSDVLSTVGGLTSQQNTRCLRRHTITDEFDARTFYAIEVRKSFIKNTATITWFEE